MLLVAGRVGHHQAGCLTGLCGQRLLGLLLLPLRWLRRRQLQWLRGSPEGHTVATVLVLGRRRRLGLLLLRRQLWLQLQWRQLWLQLQWLRGSPEA